MWGEEAWLKIMGWTIARWNVGLAVKGSLVYFSILYGESVDVVEGKKSKEMRLEEDEWCFFFVYVFARARVYFFIYIYNLFNRIFSE